MGRRRPRRGAPSSATSARVGILVNAAGILDGYAPADELSPALWERVIAINLTGHVLLRQARAARDARRAGCGRIINIASVAGVVGSGGGPAYTASKHGVLGITRQLAITYAERGVTVNAIGPGAIATGLRANSTRILGATRPSCAASAATRPPCARSRRRDGAEPLEEIAACGVLPGERSTPPT